MSELYWITRLDGINTFFIIILTIAIFALVFCIVYYCYSLEEEKLDGIIHAKRYITICSIAFFIGLFGKIFVPTTKEAMIIYGIGGTIDYIQSNETAKQLPDKCIKALDMWIEELTKEEE